MPAIELGLRVFPAFELETLALHNDLSNGIYTISSPGFQLTNKSLCKSWGLSASRIPWVCVSHSVMSNSCDPLDCSPPGFSVHGILQARTLEWVAIPFSRGSSQPMDRTGSPEFQTYSLLSKPSENIWYQDSRTKKGNQINCKLCQ